MFMLLWWKSRNIKVTISLYLLALKYLFIPKCFKQIVYIHNKVIKLVLNLRLQTTFQQDRHLKLFLRPIVVHPSILRLLAKTLSCNEDLYGMDFANPSSCKREIVCLIKF